MLVARRLIGEKNEVVIVERSLERCAELEEVLDAKIVHGDAASIGVLEKAGLASAEMLIAVTNHDEANVLACLIAQAQSRVKIKLARLRPMKWTAGDRFVTPVCSTSSTLSTPTEKRPNGFSGFWSFLESPISWSLPMDASSSLE